MKTKRKHAFTLIELLVVITIIAILAGLAVPTYTAIQTTANQTRGVNNARQIITSMKLFAKDHSSQYPDSVANPLTGSLAQTANDAFRFMIQERIVSDERIFGCPAGYTPDGSIGVAPDFSSALTPGENHWAMTANQTDTTVGTMPLVFENSATASWPPLWNANVSGQIGPGRTWPGGKIIVGRNDGSVTVETLSDAKGMVGPKPMPGGSNMFTQASEGISQRILPVAYGSAGANTPIEKHPHIPPPAFDTTQPAGPPGALGAAGAPAAPGRQPPSDL